MTTIGTRASGAGPETDGPDGRTRREDLERIVVEELRAALFMEEDEELPGDESFFTFGLSSLRLVEVKEHIEARTGIVVDTAAVFNYPTVDALVGHLLQTAPADGGPR